MGAASEIATSSAKETAVGMLHDLPARYARATGATPNLLVGGFARHNLLVAEWQVPPHRTRNLWVPHHVVSYQRQGSAMVTRTAGGLRTQRIVSPRSIILSPGDRSEEWSIDGSLEVVHLYISAPALRCFGEHHFGMPGGLRLRGAFGVVDPWLAGYFQMLAKECSGASGEGSIRAGSVFLDESEPLLFRHLLREYGGHPEIVSVGGDGRTRAGSLSFSAERLLDEYISSQLAGDLSLATLAKLVDISVDHFVRAFRLVKGKTPHRYVVERRLERAAVVLATAKCPVYAVARACGFSSAAHFTAKFRALYGITPSQYRHSL